MATYSKKDFNSSLYNTARPSYPDSFYKHLMEYHGSSRDLAVDVGCGSGFVAFKLTEFFDKVLGTDISETMIRQCKSDEKSHRGNIDFAVAPAEKFPDAVTPGSVDLITGAECLHWVDHPAFFSEAARVLKKGGTLAYWFYMDPVFPDSLEASKINLEYSYDSSKENHGDLYERFFGPYYEQPGHNYLRSALVEVSPPLQDFEHVTRLHFNPLTGQGQGTPLYISKNISLNVYRDYVKSWSGYNTWKADNPDKPDAGDELIDKLAQAMGVDVDTPVHVVFPTVFTLAKRR